MDIVALATVPENWTVPLLTGLLVSAVRRGFRADLQRPWGQRIMPLLPFFVGLALALLGLGTAGPWRERAVLGLVAGATASAVYKVLRTSLLARGLDLEDEDDV